MSSSDAGITESGPGVRGPSYDPFMPDDEAGPDTEQAPTAASPDAATAYSAEPLDYDDADEYPTEQIVSRSWGVAAGIAALVVVLGAVVAVLVWLVGQPAPSATVAVPAPSTSSVTVTPEASPSPEPTSLVPTTVVETHTVTATPEVVPTTVETVAATPVTPGILPPEVLAAYDRQFLAQLRSESWVIWDADLMTRQAHGVCAMLQQGAPPQVVSSELSSRSGMPLDSAVSMTRTAMFIYPNCP